MCDYCGCLSLAEDREKNMGRQEFEKLVKEGHEKQCAAWQIETGDDCMCVNGQKNAARRGDSLKKDHRKPMWDLLPFQPVGQIVEVLTFGANKYGPNTWQQVPDAKNRYFAALMRHLTAWWDGEDTDPESGIHHLAHAGCNLVFLMWFDERINKNPLVEVKV